MSIAGSAQEPPVNMHMRARWPSSVPCADVWGDGHFLFGAHYQRGGGPAQITILDILNPDAPVLASIYFIPPPGNQSGPEDVQASNGLLFTGNETVASGSDGAFVADVRNPYNPRYLGNIDVPNFRRVHTLSYDPDSRFLYLANSRRPEFAVIDLRWLTPDMPPFGTITSPTWHVQNVGSSFVHEVYARNGRLYAAAWDSGVWVYDVSDVANSPPRLLGFAPGNSTHSAVPSEDGRFIVTAEEFTGGGIKLYEATPNGQGGLNILLRDSFTISTSRATSAHQPFIKGNRVYVSWYEAGVQVFEINRDTKRLEWVASFDTSPYTGATGYNGCWSVYPYLGDDRILVGDIQTGFWILALEVPTVVGTVQVAGLTRNPTGLALTVEFHRPVDGQLVATYSVVPESDGHYRLEDVRRGTYDVIVRAPGLLCTRANGQTFAYGQVTTLNLTLRAGDVNEDGHIDDADLLQVLFAFGQTGSNLPEDLDRNGTVDDADLLAVLFNFGSGC
jgi:hypothetical protein